MDNSFLFFLLLPFSSGAATGAGFGAGFGEGAGFGAGFGNGCAASLGLTG